MDAPLTALEAQLRHLSATLSRLVVAQRDLMPAPATFWHGQARQAYDRALQDVESRFGSALEAAQLAHRSTLLALAEELRRA